MNNALDFISAYNIIDARLRALYRGKGSPQFTDLVRRVAQFNATVKRYEEELVSFARLRNAIVHESTRERIIAQPCDDVTQLITHIAQMLSAPPTLAALKERQLMSMDADDTLADAIARIARSGYSNLPVYRGGRMVGVINNRRIVHAVGIALDRGEDIDEFLRHTCASVLREEDMQVYYKILSRTDTVQDAIDAFAGNRRLLAVLVSDKGGKLTKILAPSDLPRLIAMLEA